MDVNISISPLKWRNKPQNKIIGTISKSIKAESMSIETLAQKVIVPNGQTWTPAVFNGSKRKNETWLSQQLFALDIDSGLSYDAFMARAFEYGILPVFVYSTFSSTNNNKYRVVYAMPVEITDYRVRTVIQEALQRLYPEADKTKDAARMFFGGKQLIYENYDARIDVSRLIEAFVVFSYIRNAVNASRNIKQFITDTELAANNGLPHIVAVDMNDSADFEDLTTSILTIYRMFVPESSKTYTFYFSSADLQHSKASKRTYKDVNNGVTVERDLFRNTDWNALYDACPVYKDFMDGEDIHHNVTWFIASNLVHLEGGESRFFEGLRKREDYNESKWRGTINYIKKQYQYAANYDTISDYYADVEGLTGYKNIVSLVKNERNRIKMIKEPEYITLDVAEVALEQAFNDAINATENGIYVIKAPTGIGKTRLYETVQNVTIAVPLHRLKDEVYDRMLNAGNTAYVSPSLPDDLPDEIRDTVDSLYAMGAVRSANKYLRNESKNNDDIALYIDEKDETAKVIGANLITTHARLFHLTKTNDTWIVDEDVIPTMFRQSAVSIKDMLFLQEITKQPVAFGRKVRETPLHSIIEFVKDAKVGLVYAIPNYGLTAQELKDIENAILNKDIKSNVLGLLNASHFYKDENNVHYISKRNLPKDKKIIVMSATANESVYSMAFGTQLKSFVDVGKVQPKGKINQVVNVNVSRSYLRDHPERIEVLNRYIEDDVAVFTYKEFLPAFKNGVANFGGLVGLDEYSGQNMAVIGTPHLNPIAYLLLASALGVSVKPMDYMPLARKTITRNGYTFRFMTYSNNTDLQEIQLHLIESELIQAIGRSRPLRNDVDVLVFSDLPVESATLRYLTDAELN